MNKNEIKEYSFDYNAICKIPFERYDQDFTFIVDGKQYQTCRILADLLSPIIRQLHYTDSTTTTFSITKFNKNDSNSNNEKDYFREFLDIIQNHKAVYFNDESKEYYKNIFKSLGNDHEYSKFEPFLNSPISVENVFERVNILNGFYTNIQYNAKPHHPKNKDELDFISSHFYELDKEKIKKLDEEQLLYVLNNKNLQIEDEDSLLTFVLDLYVNDHKNSHLFEYVAFSNVSADKMCEFSNAFDVNDININIWNSICRRLSRKSEEEEILPGRYYKHDDKEKSKKESEEKIDAVQIEYVNGNEFNGIFKYLTEKSGGNIHENGTIEITSNVTKYTGSPLRNIVDFSTNNYYDSNDNEKLHTVTFDFKSRQVKVSKYTIISPNFDIKSNLNYHMKSWFLESSKDGKKWETIDHRENCSTIKGKLITATFDAKMNDFCRFIRYRQADTNWGDDYYLTINSLELYGSLKFI